MKLDTREAILVAAAMILSEEGPAALTIRRIAQEVNASTKVIYTAFGGKDGLLDALYLHSFAGLEEAFRRQSRIADPKERLAALCIAYRDYALAQRALYNVMFGDLGRAYEAPPESRRQASETFRLLREGLAAAMKPTQRANAVQATRLLWAAMHGVVSLQMRGLLSYEEEALKTFGQAVSAVCQVYNIETQFDDQSLSASG